MQLTASNRYHSDQLQQLPSIPSKMNDKQEGIGEITFKSLNMIEQHHCSKIYRIL
jgi:hypothetical protein